MIMSEPIHLRVKRILAGKIEDAVDAMERAGGSSVMREAVREVERAIDDVRSEQVAAASQRLQAIRQQQMAGEHIQKLAEKAKFAMEQGRDDLAEAAVTRQIDFEGQIPALQATEETAKAEEARLEAFVLALASRKIEMEQSLQAFEIAQREATTSVKVAGDNGIKVERAISRAETAFDRAMTGAGGLGFTRSDAGTVTKVAELDVLQRQSQVAQRMAALRAG
jgi:phage shock protein A